ncbi:MAG: hypothetical protein ACI4JA_02700 [Oscillospiraceae bacterium]
MYDYSFFQWLMFFYIYCFVGWCIESTIVSVEKKKFVNRGFLRSPMLPIYGFGAIVILLVSLPVRENPFLVYVCGMTGTTILEYFTGWLMEKLLKMKYWDYSDDKFNIKGYICLQSSLFWGFLSLLLTYVLHKPVESLVLGMPKTLLMIILSVITLIFISDLIYAVRTALDVNKLLAKLSEIRLQIELAKAELAQRREQSETAAKLEELRADFARLTEKISFFKRDFILAHPTARSQKFNEALTELRERLSKRSQDK